METAEIKKKKLFLLLMKYTPIIQMIGVLLNNTLYYFDICVPLVKINNYLVGNSIILITLLYIYSYVFNYCYWYRLVITSNLVVITINIFDILFHIPVTNLQLLILYYIVYTIFVILILIKKFKMK